MNEENPYRAPTSGEESSVLSSGFGYLIIFEVINAVATIIVGLFFWALGQVIGPLAPDWYLSILVAGAIVGVSVPFIAWATSPPDAWTWPPRDEIGRAHV